MRSAIHSILRKPKVNSLLPDNFKEPELNTLTIIPFGGCGEFGMNMTAYIFGGQLFLVDCGLMFPDSTKLGVDCLIPEADAIFEHFGGVAGYILTHGHEDHIGAVPFIAPKWPAPIYGTAWTVALVKEKFLRHGLGDLIPLLKVVKAGDTLELADNLFCDWVHINHSIPMTCAVVLRTPAGNVFHTGDFKLDLVAPYELPVDLYALSKIGDQGVSVLLCDSTNASSPQNGPNEREVREGLKAEILAATGTVFVTTFSSNFWRMRTLIDICAELGKRLLIFGAGMQKNFKLACELELAPESRSAVIDENDLANISRDKLVVLASGCQGEQNSALSRLARGETRRVRLASGDTVIFSSRVIPGNERSYLGILNHCAQAGVKVVTHRERENIHASGHGSEPDIRELLERIKPRYFLPVHGSHIHLAANRKLALGQVATDRILAVEDGLIFQLKGGDLSTLGKAETTRLYIDSWSALPMTSEVLRERLKIGSLGLVVAAGAVSRNGEWFAPLDLSFVGLPMPQEFDHASWSQDIAHKIAKIARNSRELEGDSQTALQTVASAIIRRELNALLGKKPVVLCKVFLGESSDNGP